MTGTSPARRTLSVVIPTFEDPQCLELTLRSLAAQTLAPDRFEVVVVRDGGSVTYDGALRAAKGLDVRFDDTGQRRGRAGARNRGIGLAGGDVLVFLDSDSYCDPELLARHERFHLAAAEPAVLLGARVEIDWAETRALLDGRRLTPDVLSPTCHDQRFSGPFERSRYAPYDPAAIADLMATPWLCAAAHNVSVPRELFVSAGGFDEACGTDWGLEDLEAFYRVFLATGRRPDRFTFDPDAVCYHLPHFLTAIDRFTGYFRNAARIRRKHRSLDWEFLGAPNLPYAAHQIRRYRHAMEECVRAGVGRLPAAAAATVRGRAPAGRLLWVGLGTDALPLPPGSVTFDHGREPATDNLHLVGCAAPFDDGAFGGVVSVDLWRALTWPDLCQFVTEATRLAPELLLVYTPAAPVTDVPLVDEPRYLARALDGRFEVSTAEVAGALLLRVRRRPANPASAVG